MNRGFRVYSALRAGYANHQISLKHVPCSLRSEIRSYAILFLTMLREQEVVAPFNIIPLTKTPVVFFCLSLGLPQTQDYSDAMGYRRFRVLKEGKNARDQTTVLHCERRCLASFSSTQIRVASHHRPGFALNWLRHSRRRTCGIILEVDLHLSLNYV